MVALLTPLANGLFETKDAGERYGFGAALCALICGILVAANSASDSRIEGFGWGALGGSILGAILTTGGAF
jgi:hypothetical protein